MSLVTKIFFQPSLKECMWFCRSFSKSDLFSSYCSFSGLSRHPVVCAHAIAKYFKNDRRLKLWLFVPVLIFCKIWLETLSSNICLQLIIWPCFKRNFLLAKTFRGNLTETILLIERWRQFQPMKLRHLDFHEKLSLKGNWLLCLTWIQRIGITTTISNG